MTPKAATAGGLGGAEKGAVLPSAGMGGGFQAPRPFEQTQPAPVKVRGPALDGVGLRPKGSNTTAPMPKVSDAAFANWRKAHPGANHSTPEARQQLLDAEKALSEAPTPQVPLEAHFARMKKPVS